MYRYEHPPLVVRKGDNPFASRKTWLTQEHAPTAPPEQFELVSLRIVWPCIENGMTTITLPYLYNAFH